jgi:hypothetical protein
MEVKLHTRPGEVGRGSFWPSLPINTVSSLGKDSPLPISEKRRVKEKIISFNFEYQDQFHNGVDF